MEHSIEIVINLAESLNILNFYLILKSYASSVVYPPYMFFSSIKNENEKEFIASAIDMNNFKNMSYLSFLSWYWYRFDSDRTYMKKNCEYSFIISYPINIFDRGLIKYLRPIYPWKDEIFDSVIKHVSNDYLNIEYINDLKKKNKDLLNKILELEKIINSRL